MKNITKISNHKCELKSEKMKIPAILHASESLLPDDHTLSQIEDLAADERLFHHIASMSDVHPKKGRKAPTGTVVASKDYLLPQINDTAPNCGMRLIATDLDDSTLTTEKISELFQALVPAIPTKKYVGTPVTYQLAMDICRLGSKPLVEKLNCRTKNEIENTFQNGNFFSDEDISERDILDVIPKLFVHIGKYRLGILGAAGNHFLDLMRIGEITDNEKAQKLGLKEGQYVFLMHTGSGLLGQYASYMYTPKTKEHLSQQIVLKLGTTFFGSSMKETYSEISKLLKEYKNKPQFLGYKADSEQAKMYYRAHKAAANFGFANRIMLTHHLDQVLEKVMGRQVNLNLIYDTTHISVEKENHFGQDVYVHRNGSVRANGPQRMSGHPIFSQTGEPVFIPSSMTTPAYLGVGTDNNESTFFSAPHGTGRRKVALDNTPADKEELLSKVTAANVSLYNAKSSGVIKQHSGYYKDVEEVINGLEENQTIKKIAKLQPVAVIMY